MNNGPLTSASCSLMRTTPFGSAAMAIMWRSCGAQFHRRERVYSPDRQAPRHYWKCI
jgi:hypothetical protein